MKQQRLPEYPGQMLIRQVVEKIKNDCPEVRKPSEPYITITGFKHIIDKIRNILNSAKERVYVSISEKELVYLKGELEKASERGLKVVAIAEGDFSIKGVVVHKIARQSGQIRLIADSSYVLTGSISGSDYDICLFSKNKPLVELITDSLKNAIRLVELENGNPSYVKNGH